MSLDEFVAAHDGKFLDFDGFYGFQCWDLAAFYVRDVIGCPSLPTGPLGGAKECYTVFLNPLPKFFDKIPKGGVPLKGDVVVWDGFQNNPYGHIAVCLTADATGFTSFDQNWPINAPAHKQAHSYNYVLGYLRPKGGAMIDPKFYANGELFKYSDDPTVYLKFTAESFAAETGSNFGAIKDIGPNPVPVLIKVRDELQTEINNQRGELADLNTKIAELQKKLSEAPVVPQNPQEAQAVSFLSSVINWLRGLFK